MKIHNGIDIIEKSRIVKYIKRDKIFKENFN